MTDLSPDKLKVGARSKTDKRCHHKVYGELTLTES